MALPWMFAAARGLREGHAPPLQIFRNDPTNRMAATTRAFVGRGALTPPGPAAVQTPAGGMNPAPTNKFYVLGDRDGRGHAL